MGRCHLRMKTWKSTTTTTPALPDGRDLRYAFRATPSLRRAAFGAAPRFELTLRPCIQPHTSMPALKNLKHEAFARNVGIHGMSAAEAYRTGWLNCSEATAETTGLSWLAILRSISGLWSLEKRQQSERLKRLPDRRGKSGRFWQRSCGHLWARSQRQRALQRVEPDGWRANDYGAIKMPSKLDAIKIDNDPATDGAQASATKPSRMPCQTSRQWWRTSSNQKHETPQNHYFNGFSAVGNHGIFGFWRLGQSDAMRHVYRWLRISGRWKFAVGNSYDPTVTAEQMAACLG